MKFGGTFEDISRKNLKQKVLQKKSQNKQFCNKNLKMAATVGLIKNITEALLGIGEVSIDNFTFKLFYKW